MTVLVVQLVREGGGARSRAALGRGLLLLLLRCVALLLLLCLLLSTTLAWLSLFTVIWAWQVLRPAGPSAASVGLAPGDLVLCA